MPSRILVYIFMSFLLVSDDHIIFIRCTSMIFFMFTTFSIRLLNEIFLSETEMLHRVCEEKCMVLRHHEFLSIFVCKWVENFFCSAYKLYHMVSFMEMYLCDLCAPRWLSYCVIQHATQISWNAPNMHQFEFGQSNPQNKFWYAYAIPAVSYDILRYGYNPNRLTTTTNANELTNVTTNFQYDEICCTEHYWIDTLFPEFIKFADSFCGRKMS